MGTNRIDGDMHVAGRLSAEHVLLGDNDVRNAHLGEIITNNNVYHKFEVCHRQAAPATETIAVHIANANQIIVGVEVMAEATGTVGSADVQVQTKVGAAAAQDVLTGAVNIDNTDIAYTAETGAIDTDHDDLVEGESVLVDITRNAAWDGSGLLVTVYIAEKA